LRTPVLAALFSITITTAAMADATVAGRWHADLGGGVTIDMQVAPDGGWSSRTLQHDKVVRQMRGTYKQEPTNNEAGTIVFTPTQYSAKEGRVQTETDTYELGENGRQLKLTSEGDTMVFEKRDQH